MQAPRLLIDTLWWPTPQDLGFCSWVGPREVHSAELSRSLKVSDRGRNTSKPVRNRLESVCAGLWAPPRAFLALLRPVWGPI